MQDLGTSLHTRVEWLWWLWVFTWDMGSSTVSSVWKQKKLCLCLRVTFLSTGTPLNAWSGCWEWWPRLRFLSSLTVTFRSLLSLKVEVGRVSLLPGWPYATRRSWTFGLPGAPSTDQPTQLSSLPCLTWLTTTSAKEAAHVYLLSPAHEVDNLPESAGNDTETMLRCKRLCCTATTSCLPACIDHPLQRITSHSLKDERQRFKRTRLVRAELDHKNKTLLLS